MLREFGLSLLELILGLTIFGILFIFCIPFTVSMHKKNQIESFKNNLIMVINFARTTARILDIPLVLAPLENSMDWSKGMILFADNKRHQYNENIKLIHQWQWQSQGLRVSWQGMQSKEYLLFASDLKHAMSNGHFIIQNDEGKSYKLMVNRLGRVRKESS